MFPGTVLEIEAAEGRLVAHWEDLIDPVDHLGPIRQVTLFP